MNTNLRCLSLFLSCYRITVKPKASDALCILPVEKCDFNFYVVHWEGWEQGISQDMYMYICVTVLTRNCIPSFPFYQRNHVNIAVMSLKEGQVT